MIHLQNIVSKSTLENAHILILGPNINDRLRSLTDLVEILDLQNQFSIQQYPSAKASGENPNDWDALLKILKSRNAPLGIPLDIPVLMALSQNSEVMLAAFRSEDSFSGLYFSALTGFRLLIAIESHISALDKVAEIFDKSWREATEQGHTNDFESFVNALLVTPVFVLDLSMGTEKKHQLLRLNITNGQIGLYHPPNAIP